MERESRKERESEQIARSYELLSRVKIVKGVYVRDDQYEFPLLLDSARASSKKGHRFGLIDSGKLGCVQLEWLAQEGADLYTSDEARPKAAELILLNKACKKGAAIMAYFHHRALETEERKNSISFSELKEMGKSGIYIHLSNKEKKRENFFLSELAFDCRRGGSWLIYYHHRELFPQLEDLAGNGAWIHVSDRSLKEDRDLTLLLDIIKASHAEGINLVLYLERGMKFASVETLLEAGAIVLFKTFPSDYKSPFRQLEEKAKKKKLDFRAYYLHTTFLA